MVTLDQGQWPRVMSTKEMPQIFLLTLFPKRKAAFKLAEGIQFREISVMTQMSYDCARTARNFGMGLLTNQLLPGAF